MKSPFRFLLILHMAFFSLQLSFAQERGMKPVQVAIDGAPATLYAQSHALLIGVSAYNAGLPPLPGVVGDINTVKGALETGGFNVVTVMNPDHMGLQKAFTSFMRNTARERQPAADLLCRTWLHREDALWR